MTESTRPSRRQVLAGGAAMLGGAAIVGAGGRASAAGIPDARAFPRQSDTGSLLDKIVSDGHVKVGVDLGFEPLQYRDPDTNEPTGYSIELTKLMMAELGAEIEYVEIPFSVLFAAAGAPASREGNYIMRQPDSTITSAADLNSSDVTIAVLAGSSQAAAA